MVGPGGDISVLVTATVIYQDDAADKLLNRELHPEWYGIRKQMVKHWPTNQKLWDEYLSLRHRAMRGNKVTMEDVNRYYLDNREEMDEGHEVSWKERRRKDEISAIQHAFNLRQQVGEEAFLSEYQNSPKALQEIEDFHFLSAGEVAEKKIDVKRGVPPSDTEYLVAGIDVQQDSLWWTITAWGGKFNGTIIDYGTYPDQKAKRFSRYKLRVRLVDVYGSGSVEETIYQALVDLVSIIANRRFVGIDGREHAVGKILIDEGYKTDTVYLAIRDSAFTAMLLPSRGLGITASMLPMGDWVHKKTESTRGLNYVIARSNEHRHIRGLKFDANFWKTFMQERWATGVGGKGCLTLYSGRGVDHSMFSEHITSESPATTEGRGRRLVEWSLPPNRKDNDWLDSTVLTTVGAATMGMVLRDRTTPRRRSRYKSLAERRLEKAARSAKNG
jgi:hypothetical protein